MYLKQSASLTKCSAGTSIFGAGMAALALMLFKAFRSKSGRGAGAAAIWMLQYLRREDSHISMERTLRLWFSLKSPPRILVMIELS
jgi:hypothetical protein